MQGKNDQKCVLHRLFQKTVQRDFSEVGVGWRREMLSRKSG